MGCGWRGRGGRGVGGKGLHDYLSERRVENRTPYALALFALTHSRTTSPSFPVLDVALKGKGGRAGRWEAGGGGEGGDGDERGVTEAGESEVAVREERRGGGGGGGEEGERWTWHPPQPHPTPTPGGQKTEAGPHGEQWPLRHQVVRTVAP